MKSKILFLTLCLIVSGVAYIAADTTFSWSGGGQKGTLTYTGLGLASPVISGTIAQSDTNATTTATEYTPAYIGQVLVGGAGTGTNAVWISKGITTNDWVQVAP